MKPTKSYNLHSGVRFKPRVAHKNVWMFYAATSLFIIIGVIIIIATDGAEGGYAMMGFAAFLFFVIWHQSSGRSTFYHINKQGLYLKRYYYKTVFPFVLIKDLKIINMNETKEALLNKREDEVDSSNEQDIIGAFKGRMSFGELIKYCSINVVMSESRTSSGRFITGHDVKIDGDFVLLTLKNGKKYLLSPVDNEYFIETYHQYKK